jgi:hypothetical protein
MMLSPGGHCWRPPLSSGSPMSSSILRCTSPCLLNSSVVGVSDVPMPMSTNATLCVGARTDAHGVAHLARRRDGALSTPFVFRQVCRRLGRTPFQSIHGLKHTWRASPTLHRNDVQPEFLPCLAHAIIETQQLQSHDSGAGHQRRSEMNRIERADRFAGKRLPRALHNLRRDA